MLWDLDCGEEEDGLWGSEDLATLTEPVRVKGEEATAEGELVLGGDFEPVWGEWGWARLVWLHLNEEEAVFRAKLGSGDEEVALWKGVVGALMLPPPPPPA